MGKQRQQEAETEFGQSAQSAVDGTSSFANPLSQPAESGLLLECEETQDSVAREVVSEDGAAAIAQLNNVVSADDIAKLTGADGLDRSGLKQAFERLLGQPMDEDTLEELFGRIDTDGDGTVTQDEFESWWAANSAEVYATLDPHVAAMIQLRESTMIDPHSSFRARWDFLQAILIMYVAVYVPYRIGFQDTVPLWSFVFFLDLAIDVYFIADVALNFWTAVITLDGDILYAPKDVANHYLRGWFTVDFLSCLPVSYFQYILDDSPANQVLLKLLRLLRLIKLLRLLRIKRILDRWEEEMHSASILKLAKLGFMIFIAAHWVCCLWFAAGSPEEVELDADGTEIEGWVSKMYETCPEASNCTTGRSALYFQSFMWAVYTVLLYGETGVLPVLHAEKIVGAVSVVAGAFIMSVLIGSMSDIISHANPGEKMKNDAVNILKGFLHDRNVPPVLTRRIRSHFSMLYNMRGTIAEYHTIFDNMPRELAIELAIALRFVDDPVRGTRGIFSRVPFFADLEPEDLIRIGCKLRHVRALSPVVDDAGFAVGGHIMQEGVRGTEMWIVIEGEVRVERGGPGTDKPRENLGKLFALEFFGELAVLIEESSGRPVQYTRSAYAATGNCILMALSHQGMQALRNESRSIDRAVAATARTVKARRPHLIKSSDSRDEETIDERVQNIERKIENVEGKLDDVLELLRSKKAP